MRTRVHEAVLGLDPPSVGGLGWRSCVCIWCISNWFLFKQFSIRKPDNLLGENFSRTTCLRVGCHCALSSTEVVRLVDVFLKYNWMFFVVVKVWMFQSTFQSHCLILFDWGCHFGKVQCFWDFFAVFFSTLKPSGSFRFEQIETKFVLFIGSYLLWDNPSALFWTSCGRQWSFFSFKATLLSSGPSLNIPVLPISLDFRCLLACLRWSVGKISSISPALLPTNIYCFWWADYNHCSIKICILRQTP